MDSVKDVRNGEQKVKICVCSLSRKTDFWGKSSVFTEILSVIVLQEVYGFDMSGLQVEWEAYLENNLQAQVTRCSLILITGLNGG